MSDLKKVTVTVKNFEFHSSQDCARLYKKVRLLDESGKPFYYKNLIIPKYIERRGAFAQDVPRTWFVKNIHKSAVVLVAFEAKGGEVEYDLDEVRELSRSGFWAGVIIGVASIPAGVVIATATFGAGLLLIPFGIYQAYKQAFKVPGILSRKCLLEDFSRLGISIDEGR
ncbi:hypothetical protein AAY86_17735 [Pseudomonas amygdali pv. tabaci str. ATCC 11528]|uniref:hypothetical protein n=1 Tax=Pseudomonas amygdali TaxID=47877 RepID=UPI0001BC9A11|nr:hypothetical protein [Pseudomonas amygdali]KEZ67913.1 hypothetical protein C1E_0213205 [Pseudomonas amygdali pv. tabaci str. ATCC 11528]KKY51341.1 hypothetical protein AAY86_17735 [Pseudomonas amygdali pv. tabaci str. ATCC 11528]QED84835.1 hypothetical protein PSYTB_14725 [Pseudomonas amygdali pv. tabaci str. ATCC 11528]